MDIWDILGTGLGVAGAGLNIYSGYKAADASKDAAQAQEEAARAGQAQFRPYSQLGDFAANEMQSRLNNNALLGEFNPQDLQNEPGYQFGLSEGEKSIDRNAGARGKRYSGATLKALQRYAQDYAGNQYQNAYNRDANTKQQQYNFLAGPANLGMGASGTIANLGSNAGDAQASGIVGANNNIWSGLSSGVNGLSSLAYMNSPSYKNQPMAYYIR